MCLLALLVWVNIGWVNPRCQKATGVNLFAIYWGGVRDESEIPATVGPTCGRMPGKIIQALKKAKPRNPLILLRTRSTRGSGFRGDPAIGHARSAWMSEQTAHSSTNYLEVEYDLSNVRFLTTSNSYNMPGRAYRME